LLHFESFFYSVGLNSPVKEEEEEEEEEVNFALEQAIKAQVGSKGAALLFL
jgi:hypothetical protein